MTKDELIEALVTLRPAIEAEGVTHVALFGSRARGDNKPHSDIDLLLEVDTNSRFSLLDLVGVQHIVQDRTGLPANAVMRRSLSPDFRRSIGKDVVEIF
jgi:uncharacterized protein